MPTEHELGTLLARAHERALAGDIDEADRCVRAFLEHVPNHPGGLMIAGMAASARGESARAIESYRAAIALAPDFVDAHNALANELARTGNEAEARDAYRRALMLAPDSAAILFNFAAFGLRTKQYADACAALERAHALDPQDMEILGELAQARRLTGNLEGAVVAFRSCLEKVPRSGAELHRRMVQSLHALGRHEEAVAAVRAWLRAYPGHPDATHTFAALTGIGVPGRASDAYLTQHFDAFAEEFDTTLGALGYRSPELVAQLLEREVGGAKLELLDAGCGTGLLGPLVRTRASKLVGLDLSSKMLEKAAARGAYDELVHGEIGAYLASHPREFDIVTIVDTLVYFGELESVFDRVAQALRPGGRFVFTVERLELDGSERGYELQHHGRYRHALGYVRRSLAEAGFVDDRSQSLVLRKERNEDVVGLLVIATRPA
jgi:predicted TPR repeat methyltransferase